MPTRVTESAPPLYTVDGNHIAEPLLTRRPDPAAMRAGHMWREAARHYVARRYTGDAERQAEAALAVLWDAAAATARGRDGRRVGTRLVGRDGGRHLGRAERQALMSAAATAFRAVTGVDFSIYASA